MTVSFCYAAPYREANANFGYAESWDPAPGGSVTFHNVILECGERAPGIQLTVKWAHHDWWALGGSYCWSVRGLSEREKAKLARAEEHVHVDDM